MADFRGAADSARQAISRSASKTTVGVWVDALPQACPLRLTVGHQSDHDNRIAINQCWRKCPSRQVPLASEAAIALESEIAMSQFLGKGTGRNGGMAEAPLTAQVAPGLSIARFP